LTARLAQFSPRFNSTALVLFVDGLSDPLHALVEAGKRFTGRSNRNGELAAIVDLAKEFDRNISDRGGWLFCDLIIRIRCSLNDDHSNDTAPIIWEVYMTNPAPNSAVAKPANAAETREIVLKEISAKWGKFSEQDLSTLKNKDDVVAQIVTKYGYDKQQVQRDVDSLMKGRRI
jgi:hypothetical protein